MQTRIEGRGRVAERARRGNHPKTTPADAVEWEGRGRRCRDRRRRKAALKHRPTPKRLTRRGEEAREEAEKAALKHCATAERAGAARVGGKVAEEEGGG